MSGTGLESRRLVQVVPPLPARLHAMLFVRHARSMERFLVIGCLSCWERLRLPEPHHELTLNVIQPTPYFPLLVRYQPVEGTASGGIGYDVRRHD